MTNHQSVARGWSPGIPTRRRHGRATRCSLASMAALAAVAIAAAPAAQGHGRDHHGGTPVLSAPIADGLAGPLQLALGRHGKVYVAQDFSGTLTQLGPGGARADIASNPGGELAGVDVGKHNAIFYTWATADAGGTNIASGLNVVRNGVASQVADLFAYEQTANPDQGNTYGFESIPDDCAAQWPVDALGPTSYPGQIDSHPYSVAVSGRHRYIADAAGNAILDVSPNGDVSTVAVLPPQPSVVTADAIAALGLPACVEGLTYDFEPVPTDVEVGRHGILYVTTLPGGPEDPRLGARGSVYAIDPHDGQLWKVASGLLGGTNLALGDHGQIFVSELFGNHVSRIVHGAPVPLLDVSSPAGLEYSKGKLYVGYDVFGNGSVATIDVGDAHDSHHH
jgi:hypothetical protein